MERIGRIRGLLSRPLATADSDSIHRGRSPRSRRSCRRLSERRYGAMIVLERETGLQEYIDTGVPIDGASSRSSCCATIFFPNSPLHDLAVVVHGDQVVAAGCVLPLSDSQLDSHLGTRHRAAIGITEQHRRGHRGRVRGDRNDLACEQRSNGPEPRRGAVAEGAGILYGRVRPTPGSRDAGDGARRDRCSHSCAATWPGCCWPYCSRSGLWLVVTIDQNPIESNWFNVPVEVKDVPSGMALRADVPPVRVRVSAPRDVWATRALPAEKFTAVVDASTAGPGHRRGDGHRLLERQPGQDRRGRSGQSDPPARGHQEKRGPGPCPDDRQRPTRLRGAAGQGKPRPTCSVTGPQGLVEQVALRPGRCAAGWSPQQYQPGLSGHAAERGGHAG